MAKDLIAGGVVKRNPQSGMSSSNGSVVASSGTAPAGNGIAVPGANILPNTPEAAKSMNTWSKADEIDIIVVTTLGAGSAASTVIYLFNNDSRAFITDNGNGAGSIGYTFDDSTTDGAIISDSIVTERHGMGGVIYGFQLRVLKNGVNYGGAFNQLKPKFVEYDTKGNVNAVNELGSTSGQTRSDNDTSLMVYTVKKPQNIHRRIQFSNVLAGKTLGANADVFTYEYTFYTDPVF